MHVRRSLLLLSVLSLVALPVLAAANSWFGTWKLNREKSTTTGDTYTIAKSGDTYHMDYGMAQFDLEENGKDVPVMPAHTISLQRTSRGEWLEVAKINGKENSRTLIRLSSDGKTLFRHKTGTHPDGSTYTQDITDSRVGAGDGLVGTWKTIQDSSAEPETLLYSDAGDGAMRMESLETKSVLTTRFDGQPAVDTGPNAAGQALAIKAISPTKYSWTLFMHGQPLVQGENTLAADGRSFTEVNWLISKPGEKFIMIYEKQ